MKVLRKDEIDILAMSSKLGVVLSISRDVQSILASGLAVSVNQLRQHYQLGLVDDGDELITAVGGEDTAATKEQIAAARDAILAKESEKEVKSSPEELARSFPDLFKE